MGAMTLADFRNELTLVLGNRSDGVMTPARLNRWINQAYRHLTYPSVHPFDEVKATVDVTLTSGTGQYTIDTEAGYNVLAVRNMIYFPSSAPTLTTRRHILKQRPIQWFDRRTHASGEPRFYTIEQGSLYLSPVPGTTENGNVLRVRVWREVAALTGTDTTVLSDYWDPVLEVGAEARAKMVLKYPDREEVLQRYVDLINEAVPQDELEASDWSLEMQVRSEPAMRVS